jgi:hypothetical protein
MSDINSLDMAFVIDTTGSMQPLIDTAQRQMISMMHALSTSADIDMRLGIVEYRDHPPQDRMLTRVYEMDTIRVAERVIRSLSADGGGDTPEAVLDGVVDAATKLEWRPHARRIAVLVGDAPPHGCGMGGDRFARGCPCGETIESATAKVEGACITLYALGLTPYVQESFTKLARFTGGEYFAANASAESVEKLKKILADEFGQIALDEIVLREWNERAAFSIDETAEKLEKSPGEISAAVTRLSARRLLKFKEAIEVT